MLLYILLHKQNNISIVNFIKLIICKYKTFIKFNLYPTNNMRFISKSNKETSLVITNSSSHNKSSFKTGYLLDYNIKFLTSKINFLKDSIFVSTTIVDIYFLATCIYLNFFNFNSNYKFLNIKYNNRIKRSKYFFSENSYEFLYTRRLSVFMLKYRFIDHRRYFNIKFLSFNYEILNLLKMRILFSQRYGIGKMISTILCNFLGISNNFLTSKLPLSTYYNKLSFFFSNNLNYLDDSLMNFTLERHEALKSLKTYTGFRLLNGYPINGQRTRSNYKTSRKKNYKFSFYFM